MCNIKIQSILKLHINSRIYFWCTLKTNSNCEFFTHPVSLLDTAEKNVWSLQIILLLVHMCNKTHCYKIIFYGVERETNDTVT